MRGILLYGAVAAPFLLFAVVLSALGLPSDVAISMALMAVIVVAIYATVKVRGWYRATPTPRSIFYGMLVSAVEVKVAFGAWVGYLIAAGILARPPLNVVLPLPPASIRAQITGVAAIVLLITAAYYALTIWLENRGGLPR